MLEIKKINSFFKNKFYIFISIIPFTQFTGPFLPDLIISITSIIFLYLFIYEKDYKKEYYKKIFFIIILFYLLIILSSLQSLYPSHSLSTSIPYLRFLVFPFAFLYFFYDNFNSKIKIFFYISLLSIAFVSITVIIEFINHFYFVTDLSAKKIRFTGIFFAEKRSGFFLLIYLIICMAYFFNFKKIRLSKYYLILIFCITLFSIMLSGERILFFYLILYILFNLILLIINKKFKIITIFVSAILLLVITLSYFNNPFLKRLSTLQDSLGFDTKIKIEKNFSFSNNILNNFYKTDKGYIGIWKTTFYNIKKNNNLFIGNGPNNYRKFCKIHTNINSFYINETICRVHPHNFFLQLIFEVGIIAIILFYLILFYFANLPKKDFNFLNSGPQLLLYSIFFPFLGTFNFFNNWTSTHIWVLVAVVYIIRVKKLNLPN